MNLGKGLKKDFFARKSEEVAIDLLGKLLVYKNGLYVINETAAFEGETKNKRPKLENLSMEPGAIYPHYSCRTYSLSINTEEKGIPSVITITEMKDKKEIYTPGNIGKIIQLGKDNLGEIINADSSFKIHENNSLPSKLIIERYKPKNSPENLISKYKINKQMKLF
mgnify:FL=1